MFDKVIVPEDGKKIEIKDGKLVVPDNPILGIMWGDGIGPDITRASLRIWDAAVQKAYGGKRKVAWMELYAGEEAMAMYNDLPPETSRPARIHRRHQRPADHAGRRRFSQPERDAAAGARPVRLRAPGALVSGRPQPAQGAAEGGRGHLPREHGRRVRRASSAERQPGSG